MIGVEGGSLSEDLEDSKSLMRSDIRPPIGRRPVVILDEEGIGGELSGGFSIISARVLARSVQARILGVNSGRMKISKAWSVVQIDHFKYGIEAMSIKKRSDSEIGQYES
jgi:hypothetical protein